MAFKTKAAKLFLGLLLGLLILPSSVFAQNYDEFWKVEDSTPSYTNWGHNNSTNAQAIAWAHNPTDSGYICEVGVYIRKVNSPTDNLYITVFQYEAGLFADPPAPDNSSSIVGWFEDTEITRIVVSEPVDGSTLATGGNDITYFDLGACYAYLTNKTYFFVLTRGTLDSTNLYSIGYGANSEDDELYSYGFITTNSPDFTTNDPNAYNFILTGIDDYIQPPIATWEAPEFTDCSWTVGTTTAETWYGRFAQDLSCGLEFVVKSGIKFAFYPSSSMPFVADTLTRGRETFPFTLFYTITDEIITDTASIASTTLSLTVIMPDDSTNTIDIVKADPYSAVPNAAKSALYNFILTAFGFIAVFFVIKIFFL